MKLLKQIARQNRLNTVLSNKDFLWGITTVPLHFKKADLEVDLNTNTDSLILSDKKWEHQLNAVMKCSRHEETLNINVAFTIHSPVELVIVDKFKTKIMDNKYEVMGQQM